MLKPFTAIFTLTALSFMPLFASSYCEEQKVIKHEFDATGFKELRLNALAGDLLIEARDDGQILVTGIACSDRETYLDRMDIDILVENDILELTAVIPYHDRDWHADYAYIDISLQVPSNLVQLINDSSGDLEAQGVTLSRLNDSSGDITLRDTFGSLDIRDSSGHIYVNGHAGDIRLQDSSGHMEVSEVEGDVLVSRDSSGDIEIERVTGLVLIERDSSGDIEVERVSKNVTVGADGSGSIKIRNVKGSVEIGSDGSGNITAHTIGGDFVLSRKGSGEIRTAEIQGNITIPDY